MIACMGGWCRKREACAHYHAQSWMKPAERLCEPGKDEPTPIKEERKEANEQTV